MIEIGVPYRWSQENFEIIVRSFVDGGWPVSDAMRYVREECWEEVLDYLRVRIYWGVKSVDQAVRVYGLKRFANVGGSGGTFGLGNDYYILDGFVLPVGCCVKDNSVFFMYLVRSEFNQVFLAMCVDWSESVERFEEKLPVKISVGSLDVLFDHCSELVLGESDLPQYHREVLEKGVELLNGFDKKVSNKRVVSVLRRGLVDSFHLWERK